MGDPVACERLASRLAQLFRIERTGGLDGRPAAVVRRLLARRAALVEHLIANCQSPGSAALDAALMQLAGEVRQSRDRALGLLQRLELELRLRRGGGRTTGMRDGAGRLLGRG
jgi:hypothetical protein